MLISYKIRPKTHWHKGFAIAYFLKSIFKSTRTRVPIYMGDDKGDEAAFIEVNKRGGMARSTCGAPTLLLILLSILWQVLAFW